MAEESSITTTAFGSFQRDLVIPVVPSEPGYKPGSMIIDKLGRLRVRKADSSILTLTSPVSVTNGGTGNTNALLNNRVILSLAGAMKESDELQDGEILIGRTGNYPIPATLTPGRQIEIIQGSGSITIGVVEPPVSTKIATKGTVSYTVASGDNPLIQGTTIFLETLGTLSLNPFKFTSPGKIFYRLEFSANFVTSSLKGGYIVVSVLVNGSSVFLNSLSISDISVPETRFFLGPVFGVFQMLAGDEVTININWQPNPGTTDPLFMSGSKVNITEF